MKSTDRTLMRLHLVIECILLLALLAPQQQAVAQTRGPLSRSELMAAARKRLATYYAWLNAPWSGGDFPYESIRKQVDQSISHGQDAQTVYRRYQAVSVQAPTDAQSVFALTYAAYRAGTSPSDSSKTQIEYNLGNLFLIIANRKLILPHTYNYTRLAFISNAYNFADPHMKDIGLRLFQRDPNDHDVEYYLADVLNSSKDPADRLQAMKYEEDLARRTPDDPRLYRLLGMIHYNTAYLQHSQTEADASIAAYQRYLQLAPPDKETRNQISATIEFVENLRTRWSQGG